MIKCLLLLGQRMLGDRDWKTAFSDSSWRHSTMECAQGLARQHGSHRTGNVCTELLFGFFEIWPTCKNLTFCNPKLSLSCGRKIEKDRATSPCTAAADALAGSGTRARRYRAPAQAPQALQHCLTESPPVL